VSLLTEKVTMSKYRG